MRKLRLEPGSICLSCADLIGARCANVDTETTETHLCNWCGKIKKAFPSEHFWIEIEDSEKADKALASFSI